MRFEVKETDFGDGMALQIVCHTSKDKSRKVIVSWIGDPEKMAAFLEVAFYELARGYSEVLNGVPVYYKDEL